MTDYLCYTTKEGDLTDTCSQCVGDLTGDSGITVVQSFGKPRQKTETWDTDPLRSGHLYLTVGNQGFWKQF